MQQHETPANGELALLALRYAAGELAGAEAEDFEQRLADDGAAREILGEAVRLSAAVTGVPTPAPRTGTVNVIRDRLMPTRFRRLFPTKAYRGHPLIWAGLGSLAAGLLALAVDLAADPAPQIVAHTPLHPAAPKPVTEPTVPLTPAPEPMPMVSPMAGMEPIPMPVPVPNSATVPTKRAETKKG